ncbi:MAG: hypothetical protein Q9227_003770 [Pyrenula ochraceoflavens]
MRMGLHRNVIGNFDPIERESRRRAFWTIRNMDAYVSAMLGLPQPLSEDDIDQELPVEVDDEFITKDGVLPQPAGRFCLIRATNAHSRLTTILKKVVKYVYPSKRADSGDGQEQSNMISHGKIQELERDLQLWMDELPKELRPSEDAPPELGRVQQHLRAYWFQSYTSFIAILSLCFFVLENPNSSTGQATMKDALEGKETLASLSKHSPAADRVSRTLAPLFDRLPDQLRDRKNSVTASSRKRQISQIEQNITPAARSTPSVNSIAGGNPSNGPRRASTSPAHPAGGASNRTSGDFTRNAPVTQPRQAVPSKNQVLWSNRQNEMSTPSMTSMAFQNEPTTTAPPQANFGQMNNPSIPDLKNVMFPSDDPFAYGNSTISALEGAQQDMGPQAGLAAGNIFVPGTSQMNSGMPFEGLYNPGMQYVNQGSQQISTSMAGSGYGSLGQVDSSMTSPTLGSMPAMSEGEYWQQLNNAGRSGFTPGMNPGVNFDDLFGNEQWNTAWMDTAQRQ